MGITMMTGLTLLLCIVAGYLLGSIPTGFWVGRVWGHIDIREHGSGSMGATNILRTLGKIPALLVLGGDVLKGSLAVSLATILATRGDWILIGIDWLVLITALSAIVGHSRPIWLQFRGGKSVAVSLGILVAMAWPVAGIAGGIWLLTLGLSQIVSLSSMVAAASLPVLMVNFDQPMGYRLFGLAGGVYVLFTHRRNLERLWEGTEPQMGQKIALDPNPVSEAVAAVSPQDLGDEPTGSPQPTETHVEGT
ncbi:MAG: glycerol-3-phosphate 1-O-acyltransferase PlsY [Synechococcaceae cyanobacterium SM2_3_2]|nr:glycerol-3-phosphate 1-O-acyltransferase PlsY [Synechococcaceae cyanobacterium SM2_3_2]